jgi:hypothetical protein
MTSLFPPRESLVVTSRLGTGNSRTFFYGVARELGLLIMMKIIRHETIGPSHFPLDSSFKLMWLQNLLQQFFKRQLWSVYGLVVATTLLRQMRGEYTTEPREY